MLDSNRPLGYSAIHHGNVLGNLVDYTVKDEVDGKTVQAETTAEGVSLRVQECNFKAIVEFCGHPQLASSLHDPARWHVGFVQNLISGGITYTYASGQVVSTMATMAPQTLPCKDAGSAGTWYDPSPFSLKRFGDSEEFGEMIPTEVGAHHPARTDPRTRYVQMGDAPGTGRLPLALPCKGLDPQHRAALNVQYVMNWRDPLDVNPVLAARAPLVSSAGRLVFRTWLALSSESNLRNLKTTTLFVYLYTWEWMVDYTATINAATQTANPSQQATLLTRGPCSPIQNAILTAPDANESVCVKFH